MQIIRNAGDERTFYAMKSLQLRKAERQSVPSTFNGLNNKWRLIIEIRPSEPKNIVIVVGIEDYH